MGPSATEIRETIRNLRATTTYFKSTTSGLTDGQLRRPPEKGAWSVHELLAHLRGCADVQGGWIARMLAEDTPTIRYASARTGMRKTGYGGQKFEPFFRSFVRQRAALVKTLSSVEVADWTRGATFTGTTPGWTQTVSDVARGVGSHEQSHFKQIEAAAHASK